MPITTDTRAARPQRHTGRRPAGDHVMVSATMTKYEQAALQQVRFMAKQYASDPLAFGHTLEVVKERYRVDPYIRKEPIRWDTVLSEAERDENWPFRREVKRDAIGMKTTFHASGS